MENQNDYEKQVTNIINDAESEIFNDKLDITNKLSKRQIKKLKKAEKWLERKGEKRYVILGLFISIQKN